MKKLESIELNELDAVSGGVSIPNAIKRVGSAVKWFGSKWNSGAGKVAAGTKNTADAVTNVGKIAGGGAAAGYAGKKAYDGLTGNSK